MKLKLKYYKSKINKTYIKRNSFFLVFHGINVNFKNWICVEQNLKKIKLKCLRLNINIVKILLTKSIFKNLKFSLKGPCFFIRLPFQNQKSLIFVQHLLKISNLLTFIFLRVNNKLYIKKQLDKLQLINYFNNIQSLRYFLQLCIYYMCKKFHKN